MKPATPKKLLIPDVLPIIPTMDVVVFPNMIIPLLVLDERISRGIEKAMENEMKLVILLASKKQLTTQQGSIGTKDLYSVGTVASIMRIIKLPEGGVKILVQGHCRAKTKKIVADMDVLSAQVQCLEYINKDEHEQVGAIIKEIKLISEKLSFNGRSMSPDFHLIIAKMTDAEKIADFIITHLSLSVEQAQELLEKESYVEFLEQLYGYLIREVDIADAQEKVKARARDSMNKSQKDFYLREQLKAIKKELGDDDTEEIEKFRVKLTELNPPEEATSEINRQINRLERTTPDSLEAAVIRNYLDCVLSLPWHHETEDNLDLQHARTILESDHYGIADVKERILDFISVKSLKKDGYTPILCFYGPPGTGKTSLGVSIAKSLGREYFRVSLGGIKDEAEIRGHRRTYVGAMPGRFIQGLRRGKAKNPVINIDEIDKIGVDFKGDPAAAMLELLDPKQNKTFYDLYLGVPFDLSRALFIATANTLDTISAPLRDRMEVIQLSGYSIEEKIHIAKQHLIPSALEGTGLQNYGIHMNETLIEQFIVAYTKESGVRELDRVIKKFCSKIVRNFVENKEIPRFDQEHLIKYLGPQKFIEHDHDHEHKIGICNGLAWTIYGGEIIKIEAIIMPGKGNLILTGQLGDVMKESAQAALSYARAHAAEFEVDHDMFLNYDLHVHVPAAGVPKDGPSAGITMLTSILSALTKRPIHAGYAMTGEINLSGHVMPIGGIREKILAAKRHGVPHILLPYKNKNDVIGLDEVIKGIDLIWVEHAQELLDYVLLPKNSDVH